MPKLKQPELLETTALGTWNKVVLNYFSRLSQSDASEELRRGVSIIQKHVCSYVPQPLLAKFRNRLLDKYFSHVPQSGQREVAMELSTDIKAARLRCEEKIWGLFDPDNPNELRLLETMGLQYFPIHSWQDVENFPLGELTTFIFAKWCTDSHLKNIGEKCPTLQVLKIPASRITDEGLRALSSCSDLRVVDLYDCPVSFDGINSLLATNRNVEDLAYWDSFFRPSGPRDASRLDSSVCPSMSRFVYQNVDDDEPSILGTVAAKFPNLTYLKMSLRTSEDFSALKSLDKLSGLEVRFEEALINVREAWQSLKELLMFIGPNITTLKLNCDNRGFFWYQSELNFIFESCPNLECFGFDQGDGVVSIPSFQKLKVLIPRIPIEYDDIEIRYDPGLQFGVMPSLESLSLLNYGMDFKSLESIMLDDVKFPNLSVIKTNCLKTQDLEQLQQVVKIKNLDFEIKNDAESNWYIEYRFGDGSNRGGH